MTNAIPQHSSESNEHYTPRVIIEVCRETMGGIDLDPASCELANRENVRARHFYTKKNDGLALPWSTPASEHSGRPEARVFCNPPGGKYRNGIFVIKGPGESSAATWFYKAVREWSEGRAEAVCFLGFTLELLRITQQRERFRSACSRTARTSSRTKAESSLPRDLPRFRMSASKLGLVVIPEQKEWR